MLGNGSSNGVHVPSEEIHQSVLAFDDLLASHLKSFVATSNEIGGDVKSIVYSLFFFSLQLLRLIY